MDYTRLLFALEIRTLAIKMFQADGYNLNEHGNLYPPYIQRAVEEATTTLQVIDKLNLT